NELHLSSKHRRMKMEPHDVRAVRLLCEEMEKSYAVSAALGDDRTMLERVCPTISIRTLDNGKFLIGLYHGESLPDDERNPIEFTSFAEAIDALKADVIVNRSQAIAEHE